MKPFVILLPLTLLAFSRPGRAFDDSDPAATARVIQWADAVTQHTGNKNDVSLTWLKAFRPADRVELSQEIDLFLHLVETGRGPAGCPSTPDYERCKMLNLARTINVDPGPQVFLKRAVVLHTDAALAMSLPGADDGSLQHAVIHGDISREVVYSRIFTTDQDGQVIGSVFANWNWPVARQLVMHLKRISPDSPFIPAWYHATTAYLLQKGWYGELRQHLNDYALMLPSHPLRFFDEASYDEIQGLPNTQVLFTPNNRLGIPNGSRANRDAVGLFRRALALDGTLTEAHVRLGRLLEEDNQPREALQDLATALDDPHASNVQRFYAHLFAARALRVLDRLDEAQQHVDAALALFPAAQSALLADSYLALLRADVAGTLAPVARLNGRADAVDPWTSYWLGPGRAANQLLGDMWAMAPAGR